MGVSPSRFSQGALRINQTSPQGGAFDSALQVFPTFTFRRLSDGETRTLDVGQFPADPQTSDDLVLRSDNQPWRAGCVPPALAVPGLNDSFCAGQTEAGVLQLNPLQSRLVRLGVRPAQAALEHFGCYLTQEPRAKNGVAVEHPVRHLVCYEFRRLGRRPFRPRSVRVRNQFGSRVMRVLAPGLLCVPSLKIKV